MNHLAYVLEYILQAGGRTDATGGQLDKAKRVVGLAYGVVVNIRIFLLKRDLAPALPTEIPINDAKLSADIQRGQIHLHYPPGAAGVATEVQGQF